MKRLSLAALCAALVLIALTVSAEPRPGPVIGLADEETGFDGGPGGGGAQSEAKREQVRKKVEAVRMWRMTEARPEKSDCSARTSWGLGPRKR